MHNLSQFLVINGDRRKKKKTPRKPKLERMNAKRNIDYEFSTTSTSSSSEEPASVRLRSAAIRGTRSLELPPLSDGTSLRIDGSDVGQLEIIYRRLGLESPEDFGIPLSSWEARKIRSTSDLIRRSPLNFETDHGTNAVEHEQPAENVESRRDDIIRVTSAAVEQTSDAVRVSGSNRAGNGIKGVRPPLLSPPSPSISKPLMHHDAGCEWDIVRTFPSLEGSSAHVNQQGFSLHEEEEADVENVRTRLEGATLSGSCSFTTSNEDDSSSSTTEPASSISPNGYGSNISTNGRFRHIAITHWQRGELLGRGSFGSVYEGICDGGYFIAVKEVSLLDQGEQGRQSVLQLEQEIVLLSQFEHENIVRYYGTDKDASKLYIFLELVTKGSLLSLYRRYHLQDCQVSSYTRQILHGLKYLHDQSVVHRDVKCANILVDANGSVKLADFGLAKAAKLNDVKSCKGTAFWMAPEVVNNKNNGYGLAADIWSLGCTVLEMLTRQIPYSPLECMPALFRIGRGLPPPIPNSLSREARDFISQCLHVNPRDRPTATQLLDHPFVSRPLPSFSDYVSGHSRLGVK
ncbi:mitogen-activated protein kinase kinase kinase 1-like [Cynara cardunculus var. scolymus]|uniref:mitogen-activated protein kinase kinase kinase 1-like n=1 Tax=Cynara cardunculus var. scolymus TaxID=59895 RepID=UPI000D6254F3|nr:mitogen-activated protein kinase kinase kinase 1-like [Cynara cardunculus var. scolymus]XP_024976122.1 mitogen-activated protein kinase kinase kinase 1-like [Cynara cardunculus var. scolymus]